MSGDGGPAFPVQPLGLDGLPTMEAATGMSKRDLIAKAAMQGLLAHHGSFGWVNTPYEFASRACEMADALLAELATERDDG